MEATRTAPTLGEWLREGAFSMTLSSGFFGFFVHTGVLRVLEDAGAVPERLSGSSAGALVAGGWAAGVDAPRFAQELRSLRRADFWDPRPGAGLLAGRRFRERLRALLPAHSFERCRVPVALSAFDVVRRRTRVLERGDLTAAIHASCAVPILFHPVWIDGRPMLDGGIADRPGLAGMPEGPRVLFHHLASRSPWRGRPPEVPRRRGMVSLVVEDLPRSGPFRLEAGVRAMELASAAVARALRQPIDREAAVVVRA